ncbi:MAG: trypsin-like peptidase domain-containing protein [Burkholderiales bacterium]|nr:trypsin-like peptidase domain-containing protein [Burkholderiales bacterium]
MAATALALCAAGPALAIIAGAPPDSPAARVDANVATSPWVGVGALRVDASTYSGVAIGRRHVLTAAHVVAGAAPASVRFRVYPGPTPVEIVAKSIVVHPDFVAFATPNLNDDLAVVVLDSDLPAGVPIYPLNRAAPVQGTTFVAVGYGGSGQGDGTGRVGADPAVKRVGRNTADAFVADDEGSGWGELFYFDFDGGGQPNRLGGTGLGNAVETSMATGDSGSPVFLAGTSPPVLLGISTFLVAFANGPTDPGTFGTGGGGQLASGYAAWIEQTVAATSPVSMGGDENGEAPLPAWALSLVAAACAVLLRRPVQAG